jgi:hypothetical protein
MSKALDDTIAAINEITRLRYPPADGYPPDRAQDQLSRTLDSRRQADLIQKLINHNYQSASKCDVLLGVIIHVTHVLLEAMEENPGDPHLCAMADVLVGGSHG